MSYVDSIREVNETLLNTAQKAVDAAAHICPGLIRPAIQEWADRQGFGLGSLIPDGWVDKAADVVIAAVKSALDRCTELVELLNMANNYLGSPDRLRAVADKLNDLGGKAEAIELKLDVLEGWASWHDLPTSKLYEAAITDQATEISKVPKWVGEIAKGIDQHANDIENYYLELAQVSLGGVQAVLGVVTAVLGLAAAIPTGGLSLAATIVGVVSSLMGVAQALIGVVQMAVSNSQNVAAKLDSLQLDLEDWDVPRFAIVQ